MFNSKLFCVIVVLTTLAFGAALYFQVEEMIKYDLLTKLDKQYLSGTFTGGVAKTVPAETQKDDTVKKDDKK